MGKLFNLITVRDNNVHSQTSGFVVFKKLKNCEDNSIWVKGKIWIDRRTEKQRKCRQTYRLTDQHDDV